MGINIYVIFVLFQALNQIIKPIVKIYDHTMYT